jgi:splicing factor 3B subunit 2
MANEVGNAPTLANGTNGVNGVKSNEKIKSKNQLRRLKAKQKKAEKGATVRLINIMLFATSAHTSPQETITDANLEPKQEDVDQPMNVEYVSEQLEVKGAALEAFSDVFARFQAPPESSAVRIISS